MDRAELLDHLSRDALAFADSCELAGLDTEAPSCPTWNVRDLVSHLWETHTFWRTIVEQRAQSGDRVRRPVRPSDEQLLVAYREGFDGLLRVLAAAHETDEIWTGSADRTVGFVLRRMAHETSVHRWDADRAAGRHVAIAADLASDGIDEFLHHFLCFTAPDATPVGGSVHLHCTDVPGEWTVHEDGADFMVRREHAKGDAALRGPASDLLLVLWRRMPLTAIDVIGDSSVATRFVAHTRLD